MWSLRKDSKRFYFLVGREYKVGRRNAEVLLENDVSISRLHATISVVHPEENLVDVTKPSVLKLKDAGSKYGTFHNGRKLENGEEVELSDDDQVKFGQLESEFKVVCDPIIITTSSVNHNTKNELQLLVWELGGHISTDWLANCTHLVMSAIKVTVKALCCLVSLKPIVTPMYISDLVKNVSSNSSVQNIENYLPTINEPLIDTERVVFNIVPQRRTLFENKTFVFLDEKQMRKLQLAITTASGDTQLITSDSNLDVTETGMCVVTPPGETTDFAKSTATLLHKHKKRLIPESDFGLAVAYCSVEKFCNPDFDLGGSLLAITNIPSQTLSQEEVCVPDSLDVVNRRKRARLQNDALTKEMSASKRMKSAEAIVSHVEETQEEDFTFPQPSTSRNNSAAGQRVKSERLSASVNLDLSGDKDVLISNSNSHANKPKIEPIFISDDDDDDDIQVVKTVNKSNSQSPLVSDTTLKMEQTSSRTPERSVAKVDESVMPPIRLSNNLPSTDHKTSITNVADNALPRNLIQITVVSLVKQRTPVNPLPPSTNNGVINFKKFTKILPAGFQVLPRIIGGYDLVPNDKNAKNGIDAWLADAGEVESADPVDDNGEFDYNPQKRSRRR